MLPERLPTPVREQALTAGERVSRAYEELLTSEALERFRNGTSTLKEALEQQAATVTGRMMNASSGVKELLQDFRLPLPAMSRDNGEERLGVRMAREGFSVHNPVVMIPGIITTSLEVWAGEECIRNYFRQRIWGSTSMLQLLMSDPDCWVRHLQLNSSTGLDPLQSPHFNRSIRVRPSQGFESADFFMAGYWLWGMVIEALADIGYDYNSMHMASYDWRLSFGDLERRDRYFTRLRQQIETLVSMNGKKAVIVTHSMGGNVWHYFLQWVTYRVHANWVHDHIYAEVHISAPMLGLPKAFYSLLTGDNRDFASMGAGFSTLMNRLFGPLTRRRIWRSCSSLAMIMPMGGEAVWGRPLVQVGNRSYGVDGARDLLASRAAVPEDLRRISRWLLDGLRREHPADVHPSSRGQEPPEHLWANPLAVPLPFAPGLKKYAFYGVGIPTDVSAVLEEAGDEEHRPRYAIDRDATEDRGFYFDDGDYSVPVQSAGLMCLKGWKDKQRNPAQTPCVIREYMDSSNSTVADNLVAKAAQTAGELVGVQTMAALLSGGYSRGRQPSGDHVDILGNELMLRDLLTVASGRELQERIVSNLRAAADRWKDER